MKFYNIIFVSILVIISACSRSNENHNLISSIITLPLEINIKESANLLLSTIANDIEYVKLEFSDSSQIRSFGKCIATKDYIFIDANKQGLLQFNRRGKFIRKIGKTGKGPGEYMHLQTFSIDTLNQKVYLSALRLKKILCFDYNGRWLNSINTTYDHDFFEYSNGTFLFGGTFLQPFDSLHKPYMLTDTNGQIINHVEPFVRNKKLVSTRSNTISVSDGLLLICEQNYVDTVFKLNNGFFDPYIVFNYNDHKAPPQKQFKWGNTKRLLKDYVKLKSYNKLPNHFIYYYEYKNFGYHRLYDTDNKSHVTRRTILNNESWEPSFINDIDGGLNISIYNIYDNTYCKPVHAIDLIEKLKTKSNANLKSPKKNLRLMELANNITCNDNPIIMIIKLKTNNAK